MDVKDIQLQSGMQFNTIQDDILYVVLSDSDLAKELTGIIKRVYAPAVRTLLKRRIAQYKVYLYLMVVYSLAQAM